MRHMITVDLQTGLGRNSREIAGGVNSLIPWFWRGLSNLVSIETS